MQLLDIVHVYMYTGIKVYDSFAFYLYIQHVCQLAETIHIEACSSLELLCESVDMCALPDDVYVSYTCMCVCLRCAH